MKLRAIGLGALLAGGLLGLVVAQAMAVPGFALKTGAACAACHKNVAGGPELTAAGDAYKADDTKVPAEKGTADEYLGANKCKLCHSKQYKSWAETKHAKSFETLVNVDDKTAAEWAKKMGVELKGKASESPACIQCHVTGDGLPGGYPPSDATLAANFAVVGCEQCHGPGTAHKAAAKEEKKSVINAKPGERLCRSCHTEASSPDFKFDERKAKVHPVAAE